MTIHRPFGVLVHLIKKIMNKLNYFSDIRNGINAWRIWFLLGVSDVRQRYSRSKLGQFWITLSMAIFIVAIGTVNSMLFKQDISVFIPFLASNIITWTFISGIIVDGCSSFIQSEGYIKQINLPRSTFVMRSLVKNTVTFLHNIIILPLIYFVFPQPLNTSYFLIPIGLLILLIFGFFITLLLGVICTRFRDLPQIVANIVQLAFFMTPIMWPASALRPSQINFGVYNPFAGLLNIVSEPLRGVAPSPESYLVSGITITILAVISLPLFSKFRSRIPYWL